ncbi:uncharacterized protein LOC112053621 [Bicyclus anynana]|uniref:Uncharacterized protein LOC112053621 n=1 Tax=Bicyclus anynana TaxID=110368 RepID=A0ABM3LG11_BICAN|nr:uncharacterized protein LOC112053621 [Bicyclus anynana]
MDQPMSMKESYAERRQLFKDIWETSNHIDETEDIMTKPKVIKTLRLSEVDQCIAKKKKQKIKNLRTVCTKLLDFCDKQEADDLYYKQMAIKGATNSSTPPVKEIERKIIKPKKKIKKTKSLFAPSVDAGSHTVGTTRIQRQLPKSKSRNTSPSIEKRTNNSIATSKLLKNKPNNSSVTRRVKKKGNKKSTYLKRPKDDVSAYDDNNTI